jgi:hypothetical protein
VRRDNPDRKAKEIIDNLEQCYDWRVRRIASAVQRAAGLPDAIVARKGSRLNHLLEIKSPGGHLSAAQVEFFWKWPGCKHVATSSYEADLLLKECEGGLAAQDLTDYLRDDDLDKNGRS